MCFKRIETLKMKYRFNLNALLFILVSFSFHHHVKVNASMKTFKKASEARIFTKSNDVTVIGVFDDLKSKMASHYKSAVKLWTNSGVEFAIATDKSKSFREKFDDERIPAIWAQVNFREDGSLRRGRKRRVGFFLNGKFMENMAKEEIIQNILIFFYKTLLRPVNFFPSETDGAQRLQMAISSRLPKLFITHNSKFNEEETKE